MFINYESLAKEWKKLLGTAESWSSNRFSRLIPTNSVYEQLEKNVSPTGKPAEPFSRSLDENNVMETSKTNGKDNVHEEVEEEVVYEDDYETESESKTDPEQSKNPEGISDTATRERSSADLSSRTNGSPRDEDYVEDPSTSQYDAYYYYEDYENNNKSRYDAVVNADHLDYPDVEEEEKEEAEEKRIGGTARKTAKRVSSEIGEKKEEEEEEERDDEEKDELRSSKNGTSASSDLLEEKDLDTLVTLTNAEEGSSMEGSRKSFSILGPPGAETNLSASDSSILIGEAVVSVVTTKSVVNGTISVPTTSAPTTVEQMAAPPSPSTILTTRATTEQPGVTVTTEDSSRILASVQTSRSISGARFLPFPVIDRVEPIVPNSEKKTSPPSESTESIIDKLDRVQSELSSGILVSDLRATGNSLQLDVLADREKNRRRFTTTTKTPVISKFVPRRYNDKRTDHGNVTPEPRFKTTLDSLEGLLPRDYVVRNPGSTTAPLKIGFRWPSKSTTTSEATIQLATTTTTTSAPTTKRLKTNVVAQDINAFLPAGYKLKKEDSTVTESTLLTDILAKSKLDISSLLPPDYNKKKVEASSTARSIITTTATKKPVDVSTEKSSAEKTIQDLFAKSQFDISSLLPRDYEQKHKNLTASSKDGEEHAVQTAEAESSTMESASSTTAKSGGLKIVFPSRPGGRKPIHKITTPQTPRGDAPGAVTLKIQRGWPTRATTEFTGWPTPSTTPISIEKLLEAARTATISSLNASLIPITEVTSSTSTTTTTTTTPRPTTPGICEQDCEVAGTIKIIGNATWVPELLDRNTQEWQKLANEIEQEMNFIFSKSSVLTKWYKKVKIDSFSKGSILVDYFIELTNLEQKINTQELKTVFHNSLYTYNTNRWNDTKMKDTIKLGSFIIDPKYTDFVVIPKATTPQYIEKDDKLIPQWAIAVIVIGVGGLLFIIIFGVSVLLNRHGSKLKPSVSAIYDEEVSKNITQRSTDYSKPVHTIWTDPDVSWNEKSFESTSNKVLVEKSFQDNKKYNMYDSWRSEWNGYYYNGSHVSSKYDGYDSTTNLSSRHHPDYDTNF
ncbi:uncharacterized protein LOC117224107 isoform X2 [Megalopta genalis]|uniref:uncharacterized protein LOC117224107 isoform X2 n=1 Tax=Megalopta genalis TaxID=115081 RepID=UPI0014432A54|nr:flocculation protein FLO11-like isoform X2 [Megalopta genalis]